MSKEMTAKEVVDSIKLYINQVSLHILTLRMELNNQTISGPVKEEEEQKKRQHKEFHVKELEKSLSKMSQTLRIYEKNNKGGGSPAIIDPTFMEKFFNIPSTIGSIVKKVPKN